MKKLIAIILLLSSAALLFAGCTPLADEKVEGKQEINTSAGNEGATLLPENNVATQSPENGPATQSPDNGEQSAIIREEIVLTKENFGEYANGDIPILVDFWAEWCGPCMKLAPTIEEIAQESDGSYLVGKINIDEQPELAERFDVYAIPTLIVFQNGQEINRSVGLISKSEVLDLLK